MTALEAYILARAYTKQAIEGAGALKGAPCQIQSIEAITGGNRITFAWETGEGETETDTLDVMDGADGDDGVGIASITHKETDAQGNNIYTVTLTSGSTYDITCPKGAQGETGATGATGNGIVSISKTSTEGLVDTYTITYTNGSTSTFTITNGATPTVDSEMSESSENPLQNKVITAWTSADTKSVTGNPITIADAAAVKAKALSMTIEPVQDLHGQSAPYVGGAGKNKVHAENYTSDSYDGTTYTDVAGDSVITEDITLGAGTYKFSIKLLSLPNADRTITFNTAQYSGQIWGLARLEQKNVGQVYSDTVTLESETTFRGYLYGIGGGTFKIQMQIESGDEYTSFAPYTNICPITGHTEASVQRDGKNLFNKNNSGEIFTGYMSPSNSNLRSDANSRCCFIPCEPNTTYTVSKTAGARFSAGYTKETPDDLVSVYGLVSDNTASSITITTGEDAKYLVGYVFNSQYDSGNADAMIASVQIEKGSTATPYVPYAGKTYTIALGDTIYGGTVDFNTGVMTVDREYILINSATQITANNASQYYVNQSTASGFVQGKNVISDKFKSLEASTGDGCFINSAGLIRFNTVTEYESASDLIADLTSIQFVAKLTTPLTVQLTPKQVQLLKGTNTLTANGASISLTYQQDNLVGEVMEQVEDIADNFDDVIGWGERKNLLGGKVAIGWYNDNGEFQLSEMTGHTQLETAKPSTKYSMSLYAPTASSVAANGKFGFYFWDVNGDFISRNVRDYTATTYSVITPNNCAYISFQITVPGSVSATDIGFDINKSIVVEGDYDGIFKPYHPVIGTAVEDLLTNTPILVGSSASTGTYTQKLQTLSSYYLALNDDRKRNAYLMFGNIKCYATLPNVGSFVSYYSANSALNVLCVNLEYSYVEKYQIAASGTTFEEKSSTENSIVISLYA